MKQFNTSLDKKPREQLRRERKHGGMFFGFGEKRRDRQRASYTHLDGKREERWHSRC